MSRDDEDTHGNGPEDVARSRGGEGTPEDPTGGDEPSGEGTPEDPTVGDEPSGERTPETPTAEVDEAAAEAEMAEEEAARHAEMAEAMLRDPATIRLGSVLRLAWWATLEETHERPKRTVGIKYATRLLEAFHKEQPPGALVGVFPRAGGVMLSPEGEINITWLKPAITFDYSEAGELIGRIDAVAEEALDVLPERPSRLRPRLRKRQLQNKEIGKQVGSDVDQTAAEKVTRTQQAGQMARSDVGQATTTAEDSTPDQHLRQPARSVVDQDSNESNRGRAIHGKRAFGLATIALTAVDIESAAHPSTSTAGELPDPNPRFVKEMALLRPLVRRAERLLSGATQSVAQTHYGRGMVWGTALLFVLTALIGLLFLERGWKAEYMIGIPAGGLGAVVSVLQRMTSGDLLLKTDTGVSRLKWFGAVRPWVGAVFGMVLVGLLQAKLVNLEVPEGGATVAFYAVLAFFFGFNERFAQDALAAAANPLSGGKGDTDGGPQTALASSTEAEELRRR